MALKPKVAAPAREAVIQTDRPAGAAYNGMACIILKDIEDDGDTAYDKDRAQVLVLVNDREHYFYADEVVEGGKARDAQGNEIEPKRVMSRNEMPSFDRDRHAATGDQAAWDAASILNTAASMEDYLTKFPLGTHSQEARLRRSQIAPALAPLPPLSPEVQAAMPGQAPARAKDEERSVPSSGNHPEYNFAPPVPPKDGSKT